MKKLIAAVNSLTDDMLRGVYNTEKGEQYIQDLVNDIQQVINDMMVLLEYEAIGQELFDGLLTELEEVFGEVTGECMGHYITLEEEEEE